MKIPYIQLVPYNQYNSAVEIIVRQLVVVNFWVAFIGWYVIGEFVIQFLKG